VRRETLHENGKECPRERHRRRGAAAPVSWVAIIAAAIWFLTGRRAPSGSRSSRAREILEERSAGGVLTTEEYRERPHHLG
jgi:uncharacterized membrane protein